MPWVGSTGAICKNLVALIMITTIQESQQLLARMSRAEKAQLLQWLVQDLGLVPGIEREAGVAGGEACVVHTRIPVWLLENARRLGSSDATILQAYPMLQAQDLANAWAYVRSYIEEIDQAISVNDAA